MTLNPTPEQLAIIEAARDSAASLMISAYAGTAKTTTIEMLSKSLPPNPTLALAFNVKIKDELEKRLPSSFTVKTMNGLGHGAWMKATGKKMTLDTGKIGKLITQIAKEDKITLCRDEWVDVKDLVNCARTAGLVPEQFSGRSLIPDTRESWEAICSSCDADFKLASLAHAVLTQSVRQAYSGLIDFDDQIYMSVCYGGVFPSFHTLIVDEAQDLSLLNHIMLQKCRPKRLIVCGDPKQSLYAFRGAASDSMGKIRALQSEWIDLKLTQTFRCPRAIVARQQHHAPGYTAAPANAEGQVFDLQSSQWTWDSVPKDGSIAILCRNNAPIIKFAFKLLRRNIGVVMLGRDLGKGLVSTVKKHAPDVSTPIADVTALLTSWKDREDSILRAKGDNSGLEKLYDRYESLMAVIESTKCADQASLIAAINDIFSKDKGLITLATAHRAKGLEWDHVVHLDPWRIPSKYATSSKDLLQEANAQYVLETRAKRTLILANIEDFK